MSLSPTIQWSASRQVRIWHNTCFQDTVLYSTPILAPLVIWAKVAVKINLHCLSFWLLFQKNYKILTFHWSKTMESGGEISLWNKCFSLVHISHSYWHPIIATSFSKYNSSEFFFYNAWWVWRTPDKRSEILLHPEYLQILQNTSSTLVLLLFSLPH